MRVCFQVLLKVCPRLMRADEDVHSIFIPSSSKTEVGEVSLVVRDSCSALVKELSFASSVGGLIKIVRQYSSVES